LLLVAPKIISGKRVREEVFHESGKLSVNDSGRLSIKNSAQGNETRPGELATLNGPASRRLPVHILIVHSDTAQVELCLQELKKAHFNVSADVVRTPEQFADRLKAAPYDMVLAEYPSPNWQVQQVYGLLHLRPRPIPCIFLTQTTQLEMLAELITEGAADCIGMDHISHLPVAIRRALNENNLREDGYRTEKKLRRSEARYRALVGNLTYGMCRCNITGKFLDVNPALVTMLGYQSRDELLAANLATDILCDPSKRAQLLGRVVEHNGGDPLEVGWKRKNGITLKVRLSGREVRNRDELTSYEIIVEDITQQRKLEDHLRQQAAKDPLTELANYRRLVETVDTEIKRSERTGREFALLFLDLDGLKLVNDRFGHIVGSQALCRLADVLSICSRKIDTPARFGGDEFALVLPESGQGPANLVAQRICQTLENDGREPKLSVSIGVAIYPHDGTDLDRLLGAADVALYSMKTRTHAADAGTPGKMA
jgi:diguanylate cyclase (GGDEF)-like protein/PAS domain S-box-containing protein